MLGLLATCGNLAAFMHRFDLCPHVGSRKHEFFVHGRSLPSPVFGRRRVMKVGKLTGRAQINGPLPRRSSDEMWEPRQHEAQHILCWTYRGQMNLDHRLHFDKPGRDLDQAQSQRIKLRDAEDRTFWCRAVTLTRAMRARAPATRGVIALRGAPRPAMIARSTKRPNRTSRPSLGLNGLGLNNLGLNA